MSCQTQANKAGQAGRISAAISSLSSKAGNLAGALAAGANKTLAAGDRLLNVVGERTAPITAFIVKKTQTSGRSDNAAVGLRVAGVAAAVAGSEVAPVLLTAAKVVKATERISGVVGSGLGALSKTGEAGQVIQEKRTLFFFKSKTPVSLWKSSLTPVINSRDAIGAVKKDNVLSSKGLMFTTGGRTWHQGTLVVKMPGGRRTITHLQSMALPATHYFFNRPISAEQAVGIAGGQIKPQQTPGFVGQVSPTESLCPMWTEAKQMALKAHLHWPPTERKR